MSVYRDIVLPWLLDKGMSKELLVGYRRRVVGAARGRVLEIGVGSGLNLPFYGAGVTEIIGLEPSQALIAMAAARAQAGTGPVSFLKGAAESIPLASASVDTVLTTWTMCSMADPAAALAEMRRVLRPGGVLLFAEHGRAPDRWVARAQTWLTPAWTLCSGGCHLDRPIADLIAGAGFRLIALETGYAPGPKPFTFMYEGAARPV